MTSSPSVRPTPTRYTSVDALRGITVAAMLLVNNPGTWDHVFAPLEHAQWNGCTPTDLIFPFFLVIVGVSLGLGVVPRVEAGGDRSALTRTVLVRALRIAGLGLLLHLLAWWWLDLAHYRPWGVLQRIGLCFAIVGMAAIWLSARMQWLCIGLLLGGYAALLSAGGTMPWHNLPSRVDTALLGPLLYQYDAVTGLGHDPEGLLSTLGALASTLLGLHAAALLRSGRPLRLLAAAIVLLVAGGVWSHWLPINKNLWTPTYVMWTAGWAYVALWLAHALVDRSGWPALGRRFGVNAITTYACSGVMVLAMLATGAWGWLYAQVFERCVTPLAGAEAASLAMALAFVVLWWLPMAWLDRRRIYLKI